MLSPGKYEVIDLLSSEVSGFHFSKSDPSLAGTRVTGKCVWTTLSQGEWPNFN